MVSSDSQGITGFSLFDVSTSYTHDHRYDGLAVFATANFEDVLGKEKDAIVAPFFHSSRRSCEPSCVSFSMSLALSWLPAANQN